jgi:hypothetical protein
MNSLVLKITLAAIFCLSFFSFFACDQPRLFDAKTRTLGQDQSPLRGSNGDPVINLSITGGFAGVNKLLVIDSNGFVSFTDFTAGSTRYTDYLTATEYADLLAKFAAADYFHLSDSYMTPDAADLFWYDLTFTQNGVSKRVVTDHLTAPASLQEIIEALERIIRGMVENSPQLTLTADRESFKSGETVKLALTVANITDHALTLNFRDGQVFDFYVIAAENTGLRAPAREWNWAHGKAFTQSTQTISLAAGQKAVYEIEWNGRDNDGQQLLGSVLVAAELMSVPGGSTRLLPLLIHN